MKPEIVDKPAFIIVGFRLAGNLDLPRVEDLWKSKFLPHRKEIKAAPGTENCVFGVFAPIPDSINYEYVAGMMVSSLEEIPIGMVGWEIPEGRYASVTVQGLHNVYLAYKEIMDVWMPTSGYEPITAPVFSISSKIDNPVDPNAFWQVNIQIKKRGFHSEIDDWNLD